MIGRVWALLEKELRSLFHSPIAYVVLTAFVSLTGVYFFQHLVSYNQLLFVYQSDGLGTGGFDAGTVPAQINVLNEVFIPSGNDFSLLLLAVLPLVTMRVFAEERAQGTDELLRTTPIRSWEIVAAKFATTFLFVALMLAASAVYPSVVVTKASFGYGHLVSLYLGQLCFGVGLAAIGLACSSLTQSQIVAAVLAYAIPFVMLDFGWLGNVAGEGLARVLAEISLLFHFEPFPRGVIPLRHVLYFVSLAALGFATCVASIELQRAR